MDLNAVDGVAIPNTCQMQQKKQQQQNCKKLMVWFRWYGIGIWPMWNMWLCAFKICVWHGFYAKIGLCFSGCEWCVCATCESMCSNPHPNCCCFFFAQCFIFLLVSNAIRSTIHWFFFGCCCCVGMQMNTIRIRYTRTHSNVWTFAFHPHKNTQLFAHSQSYHTINTRLCVDIYFITREFCLTLLVRFNFSPACRSGFFSILRVSHGICSMFFFVASLLFHSLFIMNTHMYVHIK